MIGKYTITDNGETTYPERIQNLWVAQTEEIAHKELRELGVKIPYITEYLWINKEDAIKWAHHCLKDIKDKVKEEYIRDYRVEYSIIHNGSKYIIATVSTTGLILDKCNSEDW